MIIFVGDWVFACADQQWHAVVDCDGGMYAKLDNGFWISAAEPDIERALSKAEYLKNFSPERDSQYDG